MEEKLIKRFIKARRAFIESDFARLNARQREAVMRTEGALLILAGAGSGKTATLIARIENLLKYGRASCSDEVPPGVTEDDALFLEQCVKNSSGDARAGRLCALGPVPPWSVLAITFTNKAARELKERLESRLGPPGLEVWASTFHSACVRILRRDIERLGFSRDFTIYDASDSERLMKSVLKDLNIEEKTFPAKMALKYISQAKDRLTEPSRFEAEFSSLPGFQSSHIARCYEEYQRRLKAANALDFDDIILHAVRLLLDFDDVRDFYQRRFRYILCDEYQDTNNLQYLLVSTLAAGHGNICVVGDDDQSIYRFRGATIENILNFERQYGARVIRLEQNYRCTKNILEAANSVISNNESRKGKKLWTENPSGELLGFYTGIDERDEADFIARSIMASVASKKRAFRDFAVLYRMNAQSNRLEEAMKKVGVPYRIIGGLRFFDRLEIKDALAYLSVIHNPADDLRLSRIISSPPRGIGGKTFEAAQYLAQMLGLSVFEVMERSGEFEQLSRASGKLAAFCGMIGGLRAKLGSMPLSGFYDLVLMETGYLPALREKAAEGDFEALGRIENIEELKSSVIGYEQSSEEPTLGGFLDEISLFTDIERYDEGADAVVLMTMHSAKGLEFPEVFLPGFEEGLFPSSRAVMDQSELEEERRLCYVAITRARKRLCVTCAAVRTIFGKTDGTVRSRFVGEIPPEFMDASLPPVFRHAARPQGFDPVTKYTHVPSPRPAPPERPSARQASARPYSKGDIVRHKAFGRGMVISTIPMGGDALLEIAFDEVGTKKLMAKSASAFMSPER